MTALNPAKDWNWDKETQSRILAKLDEIACAIVNSHRKKGAKQAKPDKQWQPDYVKKAKREAASKRQEKQKRSRAEMAAIRAFWQQRNPNVRMM